MKMRSIGAGLALAMLIASPQIAQAQHHEPQKEYRDSKRKNTIIGVGLGLLGGALLSGGDPWATIGGAAAGGVIGNATTKDKRPNWDDRRDRGRRDDRRNRWDDRGDDRRDRDRRW
ncbi:MAG TPA: hypothetical protein VF475_00835 [Sphingobium sp.]